MQRDSIILSMAVLLMVSATGPVLAEQALGQPGSGASLCDRLADTARSVPAASWKNGDKALAPALTLHLSDESKFSKEEARLAADPEIRKAIEADADSRVTIQKMPGEDLYLAETVRGTAGCGEGVFASLSPGGSVKIVASPSRWESGCYGSGSNFGHAYGQKALFYRVWSGNAANWERITVYPRLKDGWGARCTLNLGFQKQFSIIRHFCGDAEVCRDATKIAGNAVSKYYTESLHRSPPAQLQFGAVPTPDALAAVKRAHGDVDAELKAAHAGELFFIADNPMPDFPIFDGDTDGLSWSYSPLGSMLAPILVGGQWYVGAIGYDGFGSRRTGNLLLAIFSEHDGKLTPLSSFILEPSDVGLSSVSVKTDPEEDMP